MSAPGAFEMEIYYNIATLPIQYTNCGAVELKQGGGHWLEGRGDKWKKYGKWLYVEYLKIIYLRIDDLFLACWKFKISHCDDEYFTFLILFILPKKCLSEIA